MNFSVRPDTPKAWEAGFPGRQEETQKQYTEGKGSGGTVNTFARKSIRQTMQDMTMHGVARIAEEDRAVWSRAVWTLKTLASFGVFLYLLQSVMTDYYDYPHKTIVEATPTNEIEFPAITICNLNTFDTTHIPYSDALSNITASTAFLRESSVEETQAMMDVYNMSAQQILEDTESTGVKFFESCYYDDDRLRCDDIFNVVYWGMTRCFTLNTSKLEPASGTTSLSLYLAINQPGYVLQTEKSAGVKFYVHDKHEVPNLQAWSSSASPGFSTSVALTHEKVLLDYPYTSFGGRYCVKTDAIDMSTLPGVDPPYRLINCLKAKAAQLAQDNCTCSLPFSSNSSYPNCTLRDMGGCVQDVLKSIEGNQHDASEQLGCPLPCETATYHSSIYFSYFPSEVAQSYFTGTGMGTPDLVRANMVSLAFYYRELILRETIDVAEYSSNKMMGMLAGNIGFSVGVCVTCWRVVLSCSLLGGNMGFFLGASVLSVCELAELGMILLCSLFNRLFCLNKNRVHRQ